MAIVNPVPGSGGGGTGTGDVVGPDTSTSGAIAVFSGTTGKVIADSGRTLPSGNVGKHTVTAVFDGGGTVITTGAKGYIQVPFACQIKSWVLLSSDVPATPGSIVIDVWKDAYANYPPTVADTITASAKPALTSAAKNQSSTLTGWTTAIAAGDILGFAVDSVTVLTRAMLTLYLEES